MNKTFVGAVGVLSLVGVLGTSVNSFAFFGPKSESCDITLSQLGQIVLDTQKDLQSDKFHKSFASLVKRGFMVSQKGDMLLIERKGSVIEMVIDNGKVVELHEKCGE